MNPHKCGSVKPGWILTSWGVARRPSQFLNIVKFLHIVWLIHVAPGPCISSYHADPYYCKALFLYVWFLYRLSRMVPTHCKVFMSHCLLWRHIVLLMVGVYSSNHRVLYTIGISMTRRFQKTVGPSVCLFVTLTKKAYSSFIIDSRKIIRISGERAYHPLQEDEEIFSKKHFSKIL